MTESQPVVNLIRLDDFCAVSFDTTSSALKAEKILKEAGVEFITIPTPREVTASCGLSVKVRPENADNTCEMLRSQEIPVRSVIRITNRNGKREVLPLNAGDSAAP
ncbi:MAG: DUF3343 domain-containing protein [Solirubrobacterales bacterium]